MSFWGKINNNNKKQNKKAKQKIWHFWGLVPKLRQCLTHIDFLTLNLHLPLAKKKKKKDSHAVPSSQISMQKSLWAQIIHPCCNVDHESQECLVRHKLHEEHEISQKTHRKFRKIFFTLTQTQHSYAFLIKQIWDKSLFKPIINKYQLKSPN